MSRVTAWVVTGTTLRMEPVGTDSSNVSSGPRTRPLGVAMACGLAREAMPSTDSTSVTCAPTGTTRS